MVFKTEITNVVEVVGGALVNGGAATVGGTLGIVAVTRYVVVVVVVDGHYLF